MSSWLSHYQGKPHLLTPIRMAAAALLTRKPLRRVALLNRQKDYLGLLRHHDLMPLHRKLNELLDAGAQSSGGYDYGEGYFYQSCNQIGISGFRDTESRVSMMRLRDRLAGLDVLEVGCNTGFVTAAIASAARSVVGVDIAPHLVEIACTVAEYLHLKNCVFRATGFEEYVGDRHFDAVLSFANHRTYDGNTSQNLDEYFNRCAASLKDKGLLIFESHPPEYEGRNLDAVISIIEGRFEVEEHKVLSYGSFLDRGRTFIVAHRRF